MCPLQSRARIITVDKQLTSPLPDHTQQAEATVHTLKQTLKTTTLCKDLFEEVDTRGPYQPSPILMDFELAIHNAVAEVWPSTTRSDCNFHFK